MLDTIKSWLQNRYHIIIHSIAFFPILLGLSFLIFSSLVIAFDSSSYGIEIKNKFEALRLEDADTARSIVAAIAGGIISLTVFSFSMVMIVLNQAASNLSNRVLDNLIGNRNQQIILGIYIGTIVYSFFLLTAIRGPEFGDRIPSISIFIAILLTILDIFLFIYFLHYITQSVKFDVVIQRIYKDSKRAIERFSVDTKQDNVLRLNESFTINANYSGVFEGYNLKLCKFCNENSLQIEFIHFKGTYILMGTPLFKASRELTEKEIKKLHAYIFLVSRESIEENFTFGVRQLREIAVKALSPGINDPGTAIESLKAIFQLFNCYLNSNQKRLEINDEKQVLISIENVDFTTLFNDTIPTIWDFGEKDRSIKKQLLLMLELLNSLHKIECLSLFSEKIKTA